MLSNHMVRVMERDLNVPDGRALLGKSDVFGYPGKSWAPHITVGHVRELLACWGIAICGIITDTTGLPEWYDSIQAAGDRAILRFNDG